MVLRSTGNGRYHAAETDVTIVANTYSGNGPLVVVVHGIANTSDDYNGTQSERRDLEYLAETGCVVVIPDFEGSTGALGTDSFLTRMAEVRTYAAATWDADLTRMALIGDSGGAMGALNYHWRNPSLVACTVGRIPMVAADVIHDRNGLIGAAIDAAYGSGAAWDSAKANRDPSASAPAALIAAFNTDVRLYYSTNDDVVLPSDITTFVNLTGVRAIPLGAVGHTYTDVHAESQAAFIWDRFD